MRALATVALLALAGINAQSTTPTTTSTTPSTTPSTTTPPKTTTPAKTVDCKSTVAQVDIGATDPSKDLCNGGRFKVYTPVKSFTTMNTS